jgi:hypothetical protein
VDDRVVDRPDERVGLVGDVERPDPDLRGEQAEVGHVGVDLRVGVAAEGEHLGALPAHDRGDRGRAAAQRGAEVRDRGVDVGHGVQVDHRQRDVRAGALLLGLGGEPVDDGGPEGVDVGGRVVGEHGERAVVPAVPGFQLLGGDQPVGQRGHGAGRLVGRHEAGVEAEQVQPVDAGLRQAVRDAAAQLVEGEDAVAGALVAADAGPGGAVVGDDQRVVLRRVVGDALRDEVGERGRVAGVDVAEVDQLGGLALADGQVLRPHPVVQAQDGVGAVVGGAVHHGRDLQVLGGADLGELGQVVEQEGLEVGVGDGVDQHRPALARGCGRLPVGRAPRREQRRRHPQDRPLPSHDAPLVAARRPAARDAVSQKPDGPSRGGPGPLPGPAAGRGARHASRVTSTVTVCPSLLDPENRPLNGGTSP